MKETKARERYQSLSKEEKQQYGCERYKTLPEDENKSLLLSKEKIL